MHWLKYARGSILRKVGKKNSVTSNIHHLAEITLNCRLVLPYEYFLLTGYRSVGETDAMGIRPIPASLPSVR